MPAYPMSDRLYRLLVSGALLLAFGLRLINLGAEPFWGDESLSLDVARHFAGAPGEMVRYLKETEVHPPLYYLMLQAWVPIFGAAEGAVRALSLLFSLALVPTAAWLAMRLFGDRRTAAFAAFIVAVLPLQIEFGQEARPYAALAFFSASAAASAWSYFRSGDRRWLAAYAAASALGLLTHYSFLFVLAALVGWWLSEAATRADRKRLLLDGLLANAAAALAFAWWLDAFLYKIVLGSMPISGLPERFSVGVLPQGFFGRLTTGLVWTTKFRDLPRVELLAQAAFAIAALASAAGLLRRGATAPRPGRPWNFLAWMTLGPMLAYAASPAAADYAPLPEKHVLFATVPLAIALARLMAALPRRRAALLAVLFLATLLPRVAEVAGNDGLWDRRHRLKDAAATVGAMARPGDLVLIAYANSRTSLNHYLPSSLEAVPLLPLTYEGGDAWRSRETLGFLEQEFQLRIAPVDPAGLTTKAIRLVRTHRAERVWIYGLPDDAAEAVGAAFEADGWRPVLTPLGDLSRLSLYARR